MALYCSTMEQDAWADRLTAEIGQNIKQRRESLALSAEQVSTIATAIGMNISRQMITNLETGRRASVSVAELTVIAEALQVAPIALIYPPVALSERVDYLPNQSLEGIEAYIKFAAIPPLFRNRWSSERSDEASAYHFFIESLNNDLEIEELARDIDRLGPDAVAQRETLGLKMKALLIMALLLRRSFPTGYKFPPASRFLIELFREYLDESEFLEFGGAPDLGGTDSEEPVL